MLLALRILAFLAASWPALAMAQAQVEAVPEPPPAFDMWNLDALDDAPIQLPGEVAPEPPPVLDALGASPAAPGSNTSDPCRHFTAEERRLLPSLCGTSN